MLTKYEVPTRNQLRYLEGQTRLHLSKMAPDLVGYSYKLNTFSMVFMKSCLGPGDFPEFSEILPTLMSCISELSEDFFKISNFLKKSMSKL